MLLSLAEFPKYSEMMDVDCLLRASRAASDPGTESVDIVADKEDEVLAAVPVTRAHVRRRHRSRIAGPRRVKTFRRASRRKTKHPIWWKTSSRLSSPVRT